MYRRFLTSAIESALADTPVVLVGGARQTGKSTLLRLLARDGRIDVSVTFDDLTTLSAAKADPVGFVAGLAGRVAIDEVQRAPEILLPIKLAVDRRRQPGRFLLSGSANVLLLLPRLADSLAGRMEVATLRTLSQGELSGSEEGFLDRLLGARPPRWSAPPVARADILAQIAAGGYPEVQARSTAARRAAWFDAYLTTILGRDVRDIADIDGIVALPRLLRALAARAANLLNHADVARDICVPVTTVRRYLAILQTVYLVHELPAWSIDIGKRLVKAPKVLIADTGLATHLLGLDGLTDGQPHVGALFENFVGIELLKQSGWARHRVSLHHFRAHSGEEVDLVAERPDGAIAGIEVKLAATVRPADAIGLRLLRDAAKKRFRRGVVLYTGDAVVPIDADIDAVPISALWQPV